MERSHELKNLIRRLTRKGNSSVSKAVANDIESGKALMQTDKPGCMFGFLIEQRLKNMEKDLEEMKIRINGLIFLLSGAVALEILLRLLKG